jgi:hypothetical protein
VFCCLNRAEKRPSLTLNAEIRYSIRVLGRNSDIVQFMDSYADSREIGVVLINGVVCSVIDYLQDG